MKKTIFFILFLALSLVACDKTPTPTDPTTKIQGRLMDRGTEIPIPNTAVKLVEITSNFPGLPTRTITQSVTTDDKGQYAFTFQWADLKSYELDVRPKDITKYYDLPKVVGEIKYGQTNKVDCFMNPYSWVRYRVRNTNPFDDRDTIRCFAGTFIGRNVDKTVVVKTAKIWVKPDSIAWGVTKNKILTNYEKQINLVPKDTIDYDINY